MVINQENLIKKIANKEDLPVTTVRRILKSAEDICFDYLSSTTPTKDFKIKIFDGLSLNSRYLQNFESGNISTHDYIQVKSNISRHYKNKLNNKNY